MTSNFISRGAEGYDAYMGRWSRRLAPLFLDFAGAGPGERVLDVGCGTGNLAFALAARTDIAAIEAIDYEEQFLKNMLPVCRSILASKCSRVCGRRIFATDRTGLAASRVLPGRLAV